MKPPYDITTTILKLTSEISEKIGVTKSVFMDKPSPQLRKQNKIKTIHNSLKIEGNTLSEAQILMSLWKVDDAATQLLMTSFYDQWLAGASETEALRKAQETVRKSYTHPNYWGAFVLIGG